MRALDTILEYEYAYYCRFKRLCSYKRHPNLTNREYEKIAPRDDLSCSGSHEQYVLCRKVVRRGIEISMVSLR